MSFTSLPTNLKLAILGHHLAAPSTIDHAAHLQNLVCGDLEVLIGTNSKEFVHLALAAYYSSNVFVVKMEANRSRYKVYQPRSKHVAMMRRLDDDTNLDVGMAAGKRKDSGAYVEDQGATSEDVAAPGAAQLQDQESPSHGWYWEQHKVKLERSLKLARALEKKSS